MLGYLCRTSTLTVPLVDMHVWHATRSYWLGTRTGADGTATLAWSFFWPQSMALWTAGNFFSAIFCFTFHSHTWAIVFFQLSLFLAFLVHVVSSCRPPSSLLIYLIRSLSLISLLLICPALLHLTWLYVLRFYIKFLMLCVRLIDNTSHIASQSTSIRSLMDPKILPIILLSITAYIHVWYELLSWFMFWRHT